MKLIIEIDESIYLCAKSHSEDFIQEYEAMRAIENGIVVEKQDYEPTEPLNNA